VIAFVFAMAAATPAGWGAFSRQGALSHVREVVSIATVGSGAPGKLIYGLTYTRASLDKTETFTTTSAACPAALIVIASMRDITMPRPAPPGMPGGSNEIILDGATYTLTAPTNFTSGTMTISSNVGSPLETWVDNAFAALAPCWSKVA